MAYSIKKWDLSELFPGFNSPELQAAFDNVEEQVTSFEGLRDKLKADIEVEHFLEAMRASEATSRIVNKVYAFAELSRSEEHTSELQSLTNLVCRLLLEK